MSRTYLSAFLFLGALAIPAAAAETWTLSGPVSGAVFDLEGRSIRALMGVPGAAYLGADLVSGLDLAAVAPHGRAALGVSGGRVVLIRGLEKLAPATLPVEGAIDAVDRLAWSGDSTTAALYSSSSRRLQVIRDLDTNPAASDPLSLASAGRVTALAVDSATGGVLVGVEAEGVYLTSKSEQRLLAPMKNPAALVLARQGRDAFAADREAGALLEIRDYAAAASVMRFAGEFTAPVGIGFSKDARLLYVADAGDRKLKVFDTASRTPRGETALEFEPSGLDAIGANSISLLASGSKNEPYYILDGGLDAAVYFVPAGREQ